MTQNIYSKPNHEILYYRQGNPYISNNQYDKENSLNRMRQRKSSNSSKSVSFNEQVEIVAVENWKKFNVDVSNETEYAKIKRELNELKKNNSKLFKSECTCFIF